MDKTKSAHWDSAGNLETGEDDVDFATVCKVLRTLGYQLAIEPIERAPVKERPARKASARPKKRVAVKRPATKSSKRKP